jgi:tryptophan synthase alpha subunit
VAGTTGERAGLAVNLAEQVAAVRACTHLPICVGFGISTAAHVREVCSVADGAIVGSALIRRIAQAVDSTGPKTAIVDAVGQFLAELSKGLGATAAR